ncbi:MAG TPA: EAL domain-containing protein [Methylobacter sp.]|jgi:diguanylate cyclase (GGDEF)-like protein/PAS domain S-box-containing protein
MHVTLNSAPLINTEVTRLKKLFELSLTLSGDPIEIFQHAAKLIGELLDVKVVCLSEIQGDRLNFLAVYIDGKIYSNAGSCLLAITPCATVEQSKDIRIYDRVKELFPEATFLQDHNAFAYCGFPSLNNHGEVVAVTCLLDDKPHDFTNEDQEVLRIIGQRIGMEIERKHNFEAKERISQVLRVNEDRLHQAIRVSKTGIFDWYHSSNSIYCSPEMRTLFGWSENKLVTTETVSDSIYPEDRQRVSEAVQQAHNPYENGLLDIQFRILLWNGELRWLTSRSQTFFEKAGNAYRAVRTVGAVHDITEKKLAEQQLRLFATAFQTQEGIIITDANQVIVRVNQAFTNITGYLPQEAIGKKPSMLKSGHHDNAFYRAMYKALHTDGYWQGEIVDRHKDGHIHPKWLTITAVKDVDGEITHYVGNFSDITERKAAEDKIQRLAFYDPLTQLPNRTLLIERLEHAIATQTHNHSQNYGALLFLDLDNFKILNDTQGHRIGDELLIEVGKRLKDCVSEIDTVSRLGGDEFVVLLKELGGSDSNAALNASNVAEKVITILGKSFQLGNVVHYISASIGIALFNAPEATVASVLSSADTAMYQAKKSGKNAYCFFDPSMQHALERRSVLEMALRNAIVNKELRIFYQPLVDSQGQIIGVEALIRWLHPEQGMIAPIQFIPLAEEMGLITNIGYWVLESACAQLAAWKNRAETRKLSIAVNISAKQFYQANFVEEVCNLMAQYAIEPVHLKLELTESMVLEDIDVAIEKMLELKSLGIILAMDDFGTGFSSLSYLKQLPFDQLKIDKSFVQGIRDSSNDAFIIQTVINLGQRLGMDVVAEGVEDAEQWKLLKSLGCGTFQGYYFCKPVPVQELEVSIALSANLPSDGLGIKVLSLIEPGLM